MANEIDPNHVQTRSLLRVIGPAVVIVGLIFAVIGMADFFASFGTFRAPQYFWCLFVGMPLIGLGSTISKFAFMGAVTRYLADEAAPVGKDVANYLVHETKGSVRDLATAVSEGVVAGMKSTPSQLVCCRKCNTENDASANFCKACGTSLAKTRPCPGCGDMNDSDARFCDNCGKKMA